MRTKEVAGIKNRTYMYVRKKGDIRRRKARSNQKTDERKKYMYNYALIMWSTIFVPAALTAFCHSFWVSRSRKGAELEGELIDDTEPDRARPGPPAVPGLDPGLL